MCYTCCIGYKYGSVTKIPGKIIWPEGEAVWRNRGIIKLVGERLAGRKLLHRKAKQCPVTSRSYGHVRGIRSIT